LAPVFHCEDYQARFLKPLPAEAPVFRNGLLFSDDWNQTVAEWARLLVPSSMQRGPVERWSL